MSKYQFYYIKSFGMLSANQDKMFDDWEKDSRVISIETNSTGKNKALFYLKKIHFSRKLNNKINIPFKGIWGNQLKSVNWDTSKVNIILIPHGVLSYIDFEYLQKIKKDFNIKCCLIILDYWDSKYCARMRETVKKGVFDFAFTFDPNDATKHNLYFHTVPYSILLNDDPKEIKYDLYYIGNAKKRISLLHETYLLAKKYKVENYFRISQVAGKDMLDGEMILYNQPINYPESLQEMINANCILEIMDPGQSGATLRYYEAVCYNKKLLTNNKNVVNLPFYNPDYIHIFEKPEDIDWEWVKKREPIDYHYDGRFSPTHLIDKIIELEEEREKEENGKKQDT